MNTGKEDQSRTARSPSLWGVRLRTVLWFVLGLGFLFALPVILDASSWLLLAVVLLAALIALPVAWVIGALKGSRPRFRLRGWIKSGLATAFVLGIGLSIPVYYFAFLTALRPMTVPQVTLTNGSRTVIFQGMIHVGSDPFYKSIIYELENAVSQNYVLFYEGIKSSPGAGDEWLAKHLGMGKSLSATYTDLGRVCGLRFQNDFLQVLVADMKANPERHVTVDVSTLDMKLEADRLAAQDPAFLEAMQGHTAEPAPKSMASKVSLQKLVSLQHQATGGQRTLIGTVCRGVMTRALGSGHKAPKQLDRIILDYRNRHLARQVLESPQQKIFITYGAEHLGGFVSELMKADPGWRVAAVSWQRAIDTPEDLHGKLGIPQDAAAPQLHSSQPVTE